MVHAGTADGIFGDYFTRMTWVCSSSEVLSGFDNSVSSNFGNKTCTAIQTILGTVFGASTAPTGKAMVGFDMSGAPKYDYVNWERNGSAVYYPTWYVWIATAAPSYPLDVVWIIGAGQFVDKDNSSYFLDPSSNSYISNLTANTLTATAFNYSSDKRLKKDITPLDDSLSKILSLNGYSYRWKSDNRKDIGVIAQEVETVFPELVHTNESGIKSVEYANLVAPLIESIKSQQSQIDDLKAEIQELKNQKK